MGKTKTTERGASEHPAEARVLEALDIDALVQCLCDLVAIESLGGDETPAQEHMARLMQTLGMEVDVWELDMDELRRDPAYGMEIERERALGVVGALGGGASGRTLVLNGHVDVVPAGELERWSTAPFWGNVRDGRVYGRGAVDMKGGLCCALFAIRAVRDAGVELPGTVLLQSVVGEEDGGLGTLAAVRRGHTGDAAIVMEPTELIVSPAQAGAFSFRVTVAGSAAHGALRTEGVNPIDKFIPIYRALRELEDRRTARPRHPLFDGYDVPYALSVGMLHSGIWASSVPQQLAFEGRFGVAPDEDAEEARRELEDAVRAAALADPWLRENPPEVEWWGAQFMPALVETDHPVVTTVSNACRTVTGAAPTIRGMPYGADMRLLVNEGGTPTVLFGPGDIRQAHAPDEFVPIAELEVAARVLALSILRFCGAATP
jgi:acetylornithine deacetylase